MHRVTIDGKDYCIESVLAALMVEWIARELADLEGRGVVRLDFGDDGVQGRVEWVYSKVLKSE